MSLQKCARCKTRPAMVFITRLENGKSFNEGICLICAREMGIKPVSDILKNMGVDESQMDAMLEDIDSALPEIFEDGENNDGKLPTLNLAEMFGMQGGEPKRKKKDEGAKPDAEKKTLSQYGWRFRLK